MIEKSSEAEKVNLTKPTIVSHPQEQLQVQPQNQVKQAVDSPWLKAQEAADYLRICIKTVYNLKCKGRLVGYNIGGRKGGSLRFKRQDLDDLIAGLKRGA